MAKVTTTRYIDDSDNTVSLIVDYGGGRTTTFGATDPEAKGFTKVPATESLVSDSMTVFLCLATSGKPHERESVLYLHAVGCPGCAISVLTPRDLEMIETMIQRHRNPNEQPDGFQKLPLFIGCEFPEHPDTDLRQIKEVPLGVA